MKVGVLTPHVREFEEFKGNNPNWKCYHISGTNDLVGRVVDFYVRLHEWRRLPDGVLQTVKVQEDLRDLNKTKTKESKWKATTNAPLQGRHADMIVMDDMVDALAGAAQIPVHMFGNVLLSPPQHPSLRCDIQSATEGLSEATRKAAMSLHQFNASFSMKISEEDIKRLQDGFKNVP